MIFERLRRLCGLLLWIFQTFVKLNRELIRFKKKNHLHKPPPVDWSLRLFSQFFLLYNSFIRFSFVSAFCAVGKKACDKTLVFGFVLILKLKPLVIVLWFDVIFYINHFGLFSIFPKSSRKCLLLQQFPMDKSIPDSRRLLVIVILNHNGKFVWKCDYVEGICIYSMHHHIEHMIRISFCLKMS